MSKKSKVDGGSDADELQALFDRLATPPLAPAAPVASVAASVTVHADSAGDSDELQSLFDAVSAQFVADDAAAGAGNNTARSEAVFRRLGHMTRKLHDGLCELGLDGPLNGMAEAMPGARQRLDQGELADSADALHARWNRLFAGELSPDEFRALSSETHGFLGKVSKSSRAAGAQLMQIVMAQDSRGPTGQTIERLIELARTLETQLLQILIEAAPTEVADRHSGLTKRPVVDVSAREGVVSKRAQIDGLLKSLGF